MRLLLVISSLRCGGAERVMSRLASIWAEKGVDVTLLTLANRETDFFETPPSITRIELDLAGKATGRWSLLTKNIRRWKALRTAIRQTKPTTVLSFVSSLNMLVILAAQGLGCRIVVSERTDPRERKVSTLFNAMRRILYRRSNYVVVQTESVRTGWAERFLPQESVHVVPNLVPCDDTATPPPFSLPEKFVAGIGRMVPEKGFDLLLHAFAKTACRHEGWQLLLIGDGPEKQRLSTLVAELGLQHCVMLPGEVVSTTSILKRTDIFVLSSRYEGFPNVLVEAMAQAVAVVSFDAPSGPSEIIEHMKNGLLLKSGDTKALTNAIDALAGDSDLRTCLGRQAQESCDRFAEDTIIEKWAQLLA